MSLTPEETDLVAEAIAERFSLLKERTIINAERDRVMREIYQLGNTSLANKFEVPILEIERVYKQVQNRTYKANGKKRKVA